MGGFLNMSIYTTPLQLGYFFSLIMWIVFLVRGYQKRRLSDKLMGWIMFILAMELQDYTFGFAGINILWNELNGFPRGVGLLFGPLVYFYFRAQINRSFQIRGWLLLHFLPYALFFLINMVVFVQGKEAVQRFQASITDLVLSYIYDIGLLISYIFYLTNCLIIYRKYRLWSLNQFSNTDLISFNWFRNFIYSMIFWLGFREVMNVLDAFMNLDFYQEWWWNLALVAVSFYIGLAGYGQNQPSKIHFQLSGDNSIVSGTEELLKIAERLDNVMQHDRLYLLPELNVQDLALQLQVKAPLLSAAINRIQGVNFNDYVNHLRVEEFIRLYKHDASRQYTLLALALDSGFNSKATFNRAFKKLKGVSPKEYLSDF